MLVTQELKTADQAKKFSILSLVQNLRCRKWHGNTGRVFLHRWGLVWSVETHKFAKHKVMKHLEFTYDEWAPSASLISWSMDCNFETPRDIAQILSIHSSYSQKVKLTMHTFSQMEPQHIFRTSPRCCFRSFSLNTLFPRKFGHQDHLI